MPSLTSSAAPWGTSGGVLLKLTVHTPNALAVGENVELDSEGLGWGLRVCISKELAGDTTLLVVSLHCTHKVIQRTPSRGPEPYRCGQMASPKMAMS